MSTNKEFLNRFLETLLPIPDVRCRAMMGEYVLYYREKVIGGIYNNCVLLKNIESARNLLPDAELQLPYPGAKLMLQLNDFQDVESVHGLFEAMYNELPQAKAKKR